MTREAGGTSVGSHPATAGRSATVLHEGLVVGPSSVRLMRHCGLRGKHHAIQLAQEFLLTSPLRSPRWPLVILVPALGVAPRRLGITGHAAAASASTSGHRTVASTSRADSTVSAAIISFVRSCTVSPCIAKPMVSVSVVSAVIVTAA